MKVFDKMGIETKIVNSDIEISEEKFRNLVWSMDIGVMLQDKDAKILLSNPKALSLLGITEDQLLGKTSFDPDWNVIHEDGTPFPGTTHPVPQAIAIGQSVRNVVMGVYRPLTGDRVWLLVDAIPQLNEEGNVQQVVCTFTDITDRKVVQEKLTIANRQTQNILESISDAFFSLDNDFVVTYYNKSAEKALGKKAEEVVGQKLFDVFPEARGSIFDKNYSQAIKEKVKLSFETWFGTPPYQNWYDVRVYPYPEGISVYFHIITERKLTEAALRESEAKFRQTFDLSPVGIVMVGIDKHFLRCNKSFSDSIGYLPDELEGKSIEEVTYPDDRQIGMAEMKGIIKGEIETSIVQKRYLHKNGKIVWSEVSISLVSDNESQPHYFLAIIQDVTESKQAAETLRVSEDKFRYVFDNSVIGKSITLPSGEINVNKAFCEMIGYSSEELKNKKWEEITYTDDIEMTNEFLNLLISGETDSVRFNKRYIHKNGSIIWGDVSTALRRDTDNKPMYFMTAVTDITDIKRVEAELRFQSEIMSNMAEAVYLVRMEDGTIVYSNSQFEILFGYNPGEMLGKHVSIVNAPSEKSPENTASEIINTLSVQGYWKGEVKNIRKDGTIFWSYSSVSIFDHSQFGKVLVSVHTDITERRKAVDDLSRLALRQEAILSAVPDIIMEVDNNKVYTWTNQSGIAFFGKDVIGKDASFYFEGVQKTYQDVQPLFNGEENLIYLESWQRRIDGQKRLLGWWCRALRDEKNKVIGVLSSALDITERKIAESKITELNEELERRVIQRTEQLEAANKELEAFSYSVSHDLRSPLRSVHAFTKILMEDYEKILDEEGKRICGIITSSATQMGELIDDLLSFSRIGRSHISLTLINMRSMATSVFEEIIPAKEKSRTNLKIGKLPKTYGDSNLIRLVWINLISNAIKYSSKEKISEINIGSRIEEGNVIYFIADNGVGFDMQYMNKLFGVFQRLHSEEEFEGNGVGLAIVQRIILRHEGKVWAEGEVGKGATFYFSLPIQDIRQKPA